MSTRSAVRPPCSSPTGARSRSASSGRCGPWASAPSPCTATPTSDARHVARRRRRRPPRPGPGRRELPRVDRVIEAALAVKAEALHPGYGFLSENPALAARLRRGRDRVRRSARRRPSRRWATRSGPRRTVAAAGVRVVPGAGDAGMTDDDLVAAADGRRLPAAAQAVGRRRRQGHAPGRVAGGAAGRARRGAARGARRVRRRHPAGRALRRPARATSRCRCSPTRTATSSTSASGSAACSGATRRSSRRRRPPLLDDAQRAAIGAQAVAAARACGYINAGTVEFIVSGDRPRRVLLHGDEHPPPGRAPGHRDGLAASTSSSCSSASPPASRCRSRRPTSSRPATPSRPGSTPRTRRAASCPPAGRSCGCAEPTRSGRPGRLRAAARRRDRHRLRPDAGQGDRRGRRPRRGPPPPRRRAGRDDRARRDDQRRRSSAVCSPTPTSGPGASTPGWWNGSRRRSTAAGPPPAVVLAAAVRRRVAPAALHRAGRPVGAPGRLATGRARVGDVDGDAAGGRPSRSPCGWSATGCEQRVAGDVVDVRWRRADDGHARAGGAAVRRRPRGSHRVDRLGRVGVELRASRCRADRPASRAPARRAAR